MFSSHRPLLIVPLLIIAVFISVYEWQAIKDVYSSDATALPWLHGVGQNVGQVKTHQHSLYDVQNKTLGFQEIKVISLPSRTDKPDAWAVAASFTGFDYQLFDGVDSATISNSSLPYTMNRPPKVVACWRAHLNVLRDMVSRNVASTLIFEDDADWDVSLKSQLVQVARGSQWLLDTEAVQTSRPALEFNSPYGTGWDLIWLGHCLGGPPPRDPRRFVISQDPSAEPDPGNSIFEPWVSADPPDLHPRFIARMHDGVGTAAYAVSFQGARKILYHMSMMPYDEPVDLGYNAMCKDRISGFTCIAPFPMIIGTYRPTGPRFRHSDIETPDDEVLQAHSEHMAFSTKMNIDRLLGGETIMKSSPRYEEILGIREMEIGEIGSGIGHEEEVFIEDD